MFTLDPASHVPLYRQLAQGLIAEIRKGQIPAGGPLPSITTLEARYPVGRVTVVNALRELVQQGFAVARQGKGYYATALGERALLGLVLPLHAPVYVQIYASLLAGLQDAADAAGHRLLFLSSDETPPRFADAAQELVEARGVRWLAAIPPLAPDGSLAPATLATLERLRRQGVDPVLLDRPAPARFRQVRQDRRRGLELLLDRAAARGGRRVLLFGDAAIAELHAGLQPAAAARGLELLPPAVPTDPAADCAAIAAARADVVLAAHDAQARALLRRLPVPPFFLAGYNATATAGALAPAITSIDPGFAEAGRLTFALLAGHLPDPGRPLYVTPRLVAGETL